MYVPRVNSRREKLIEIVNKSGGITIEKLVEKHGLLGAADPWYLICRCCRQQPYTKQGLIDVPQ